MCGKTSLALVDDFVAYLLLSLSVKECWKSGGHRLAKLWQDYLGIFFDLQCIYYYNVMLIVFHCETLCDIC